MNTDLRELLASWPYDHDDSTKNYRRIEGADGRPLIQIREPLGILQFEYDGRPDGLRPQGKSSWLEWYKEKAIFASGEFSLSHEDCVHMMQEGIIFYQRYLILYQMEDWEGVVRDTDRNLEYFELTKRYAEHPEDSLAIEQYRPYVMRINSIARSNILWHDRRFDEAIEILQTTAKKIRALSPVDSPIFKLEAEKSVNHLKQLVDELETSRPWTKLEQLRQKKNEAVEKEDFERAAQLRDEIRVLEGERVAEA
ncbi:UvrB/UvrC motif-containing protein [Candidatus Sumerlaeota bacterium]|nr:UvrB/UvrC motif-containing protein [Candidatus Sumerlaeota bacterium]